MNSSRHHEERNQENYKHHAEKHNELGLDATLYLAYRDIPKLLKKHLFNDVKKETYRVLDFGCGAGLSTELIMKMIVSDGCQVEVCGVDINEQNIGFAKKRLQDAKFFHINAGDSLSHLGTFDVVICNFVLVETKENMMTDILKNIQSLLNETGVAIVTNCASKAYKQQNKWCTFNNKFEENVASEERDGKFKFKEDQPIKVEVFTSQGSTNSFVFFDFFHSGAAYRRAYEAVGLNLLATHKPIGKETDGIAWKAEMQLSPYKIHILSKQEQPALGESIRKKMLV